MGIAGMGIEGWMLCEGSVLYGTPLNVISVIPSSWKMRLMKSNLLFSLTGIIHNELSGIIIKCK